MTSSSSSIVSENLRHSRDRLAIEEQETDLRLDIVRLHRKQFEQILTLHLERIMMSAAAQKTSLFDILTGSSGAAATTTTSSSSPSVPSNNNKNNNNNNSNNRSRISNNTMNTRNVAAASSSPTSISVSVSPRGGGRSFTTTTFDDSNNYKNDDDEEDGNNMMNNSPNNTQQRHHHHQDPNMISCKRLFAGASAKSLGRMSRVIPMKIPNTNDIKRRHACFRKLRQDIAHEQGHLQEFVDAEERRRQAYEKSREELFRKTEEKSLKDRLRHDLAMKRRPPEVGIETAVASDAKLMKVEERKRQKEIALQALSDTRRQIWIRTHKEVDWAKHNFLEQQRRVQATANRTVLDSQEQKKRTDSDLNDISIIANIHRRSHRAEAANRRREIASEQSRLLNLSRAVTERNFESTGITVETSWEEEKSPMPPTGRGKKVSEISDSTYDRLCGTPRAPIPKFAGAADALKHMSHTAWDAMSELQHDSRLRALEFARFHSAGKMPPVAWK